MEANACIFREPLWRMGMFRLGSVPVLQEKTLCMAVIMIPRSLECEKSKKGKEKKIPRPLRMTRARMESSLHSLLNHVHAQRDREIAGGSK